MIGACRWTERRQCDIRVVRQDDVQWYGRYQFGAEQWHGGRQCTRSLRYRWTACASTGKTSEKLWRARPSCDGQRSYPERKSAWTDSGLYWFWADWITELQVCEFLDICNCHGCGRWQDCRYCELTDQRYILYSKNDLRWQHGVVVSGVGLINEVNRHRARLVLGWVTVCGRVNHLGM